MIEPDRNNNILVKNRKINWKKLYNQTLEYIVAFARKNPDCKIILKGKNGVHKEKHLNSIILPKNCLFIKDGAGHKLLHNSLIVIAFNSTIVLETILANRNLIIPNFNNERNIVVSNFNDRIIIFENSVNIFIFLEGAYLPPQKII